MLNCEKLNGYCAYSYYLFMIKLNITSQNYVYKTDQPQPNTKEDPKIWPQVSFFSSRGQIFKKKKCFYSRYGFAWGLL